MGTTTPNDDLPNVLHDSIPRSFAAVQQAYEARIKARATRRWKRSKRYGRIAKIDNTLPSNKFMKLIKHRTRWQTALYMRLRTGRAQLNADLFQIGMADSPVCEQCNMANETVKHFLLECPVYETARRPLRAKFGPRKAGDI
jgi:hypothetical protein